MKPYIMIVYHLLPISSLSVEDFFKNDKFRQFQIVTCLTEAILSGVESDNDRAVEES